MEGCKTGDSRDEGCKFGSVMALIKEDDNLVLLPGVAAEPPISEISGSGSSSGQILAPAPTPTPTPTPTHCRHSHSRQSHSHSHTYSHTLS